MKKSIVFLFVVGYLNCSALAIKSEQDTLLRKENVALVLDNGFSLVAFSVSGDLYLTSDALIFHPKPYFGKRYEMYSDYVSDIILPYEIILKAKKATFLGGGLKIKTKDKTFKIAIASKLKQLPHKKLKETVELINKMVREHAG